jgi:dTDP-4-amino-4,6-dideoxygalactose transaminase
VDVVENIARYRRPRKQRYDRLKTELRDWPGVRALPLPERGVPVRMPILVEGGLSEDASARLNRVGVDHHYTTAYPMHGASDRPNANRFYENLYTLPVHQNADPEVVLRALRNHAAR